MQFIKRLLRVEFENWDKYDQKGIGWTCSLQSLQAAPAHGTGLLASTRSPDLCTLAHGTSLQTISPPRSLHQLCQRQRK